MDAKEFGNELRRVFKSLGGEPNERCICNGVECSECPFYAKEQGVARCILIFERIDEAIDIVTAWSEEHPKATNKMEFVDELKRMMDSKGRTDGICNGVSCSNCEFNEAQNRCVLLYWNAYESLYKTIEIVEEWSKEHPKRTNRAVLLEKFPDARLLANGTPAVCVSQLGIVADCVKGLSCSKCWNQEYKEVGIEGSDTE